MFEILKPTIIKDGKIYEIYELEHYIDVTDQNDGIPTVITHVLKGFPEDLLIVIENPNSEDGEFYFAHKVGDTGLIVQLEDERIYGEALDLLMRMIYDF